MSLLYRAIWRDDVVDLADLVLPRLREWVLHKSENTISVLPENYVTQNILRGGKSIDLEFGVETIREANGQTSIIRSRFVENSPDGDRWDTTLRAWRDPGYDSSPDAVWIWVDLEAVGPTIERVSVASPNLVRRLLEFGYMPRRGVVEVRTEATGFYGRDRAEELAEIITALDRDLPIVVFAAGPKEHSEEDATGFSLDDVVRMASSRAAGIAQTTMVDQIGSEQLAEALGPDYAVIPGGLRIFMPGVDPAIVGDAWRHEVVSAGQIMRRRDAAARRIIRRVGAASAVKRPPESWNRAVSLLREQQRGSHTDAELLELAYTENERLVSENRSAREQLEIASEKYEAVALDYQESIEIQASLAAKIDYLSRRNQYLESKDSRPSSIETDSDQQLPQTAENPSEAARLAQTRLSDALSIPEQALVDLDDLDAAVESGAWGTTAWQAFRALHSYALAIKAGSARSGFWDWCTNSGHPYAWRATPKKLAMRESDSVKNNRALRSARILPIIRDGQPGTEFMESHIKVAEGGGNLAPRIYFLVDSSTGIVHVGFFGPHRRMPNTRT